MLFNLLTPGRVGVLVGRPLSDFRGDGPDLVVFQEGPLLLHGSHGLGIPAIHLDIFLNLHRDLGHLAHDEPLALDGIFDALGFPVDLVRELVGPLVQAEIRLRCRSVRLTLPHEQLVEDRALHRLELPGEVFGEPAFQLLEVGPSLLGLGLAFWGLDFSGLFGRLFRSGLIWVRRDERAFAKIRPLIACSSLGEAATRVVLRLCHVPWSSAARLLLPVERQPHGQKNKKPHQGPG